MKHTRETIIEYIDQCRKNGKRIGLQYQDLSNLDMRGLDLRDANLQNTDLRDANLQNTDLRDANLQGANLRGANLQNTDLRCTDMRCTDMRRTDLRCADMRCANLDYAGYELSCKTIGIIADKRLVSQLLYHLCRMDVRDCPEWTELRNDERVIKLANQSHVIPARVLPIIEKLKAQEES